jgi:hypothetical protein
MTDPVETSDTERRFQGFRLLMVIAGVVVALAIVSGLVDWLVLGSLEGRVF